MTPQNEPPGGSRNMLLLRTLRVGTLNGDELLFARACVRVQSLHTCLSLISFVAVQARRVSVTCTPTPSWRAGTTCLLARSFWRGLPPILSCRRALCALRKCARSRVRSTSRLTVICAGTGVFVQWCAASECIEWKKQLWNSTEACGCYSRAVQKDTS